MNNTSIIRRHRQDVQFYQGLWKGRPYDRAIPILRRARLLSDLQNFEVIRDLAVNYATLGDRKQARESGRRARACWARISQWVNTGRLPA